MTMPQVAFWLEAMAYDAELMSGEGHRKTRSLDELAAVLPKEEKKE